jgi:hypothetical protein
MYRKRLGIITGEKDKRYMKEISDTAMLCLLHTYLQYCLLPVVVMMSNG